MFVSHYSVYHRGEKQRQYFTVCMNIINSELMMQLDIKMLVKEYLACVHAQSLSHVQLFVCSPPGSSVHGISQIRILERAVISFSRGSSHVSYIAGVAHLA